MSSPTPSPLADATSSSRGAVSAVAQSFAGQKTLIDGAVIDARLARVPHAHTITDATVTLTTPGTRLHLSGAADFTITAVPSLAAGAVVGQEVQLVNTGTKLITLQAENAFGFQPAALAGSKLLLKSQSVTLAPSCSLTVVWDGSHWNEVHRATFGGTTCNVMDFGAVGDSVADDYPAFRKAIDSLSAQGASYGGTIYVPRGRYLLSQSLRIDKQIRMVGESGGVDDPGTVIRPNGAFSGIIVERYSSSEFGGAGDSSTFEHITVHHIDKSGGVDVHAFDIKAQSTFRNCIAWGAPGNGFNVVGSLPLAPDLCHFDECWAIENSVHGFHFQGGDANAGLCYRCSAIGNGDWGFHDASFLGNTFVACHTDSNGVFGVSGGCYTSTFTTAQSMFLGCYAEENQNAGSLNSNSMAIGGLSGWDSQGITGGGFHFSGYLSRWMKFQNDNRQGSAGGIMTVGAATRSGEFLNWETTEDTADVAFNFGATTAAGFDGHYAFNYGHVAANYLMLAAKYGQTPDGRSTGPGGLVLPAGFYTGVFGSSGQTPQSALRVIATTGVPNYGNWDQGDKLAFSQPVSGGNHEWVCLTSGTFGTYSEGLTADCEGGYHLILSAPTAVLTPGKWVRINSTNARINVLPPWRRETNYAINQKVFSGSSAYRCITAGLSSVASPPTGTGSDISDGNGIDLPVHWEYLGASDRVLCLSAPISGGAGLAIAFIAPTFEARGAYTSIGTANGLSVSGSVLSLANAIAAGASGAMTGSDKTKLDAITGSHTGTNTGDVTLGTANGLSLSGQVLSLANVVAAGASGVMTGADKTKLDAISGTNTGDEVAADATHNGYMSITTQAFAGAKTFNESITTNKDLIFDNTSASGDPWSNQGNAIWWGPSTGSNSWWMHGIPNNSFRFGNNTSTYMSFSLATGKAQFPNGIDGTAVFTSSAASAADGVKLLDGALINFSTADTNAKLSRVAANVVGTSGKLVATAGLGAGNSASATVAVGTLVKKLEVFDATGTSLGFIPVYSSIT